MNLFDLERKYELLLTPFAVPVGYYSSEVGQKLYLSALSERNEDAAVCLDKDDRPEPDSELRDTESVPLSERVEADIRQVKKEIIEMLRGVNANKT